MDVLYWTDKLNKLLFLYNPAKSDIYDSDYCSYVM